MTSITFNYEIEDVDGEIFKRVDDTDAYMNKYGVLFRRSQYTLKDINKNKINSQGYHIFKINNKNYCLEPTMKRLFNTTNYKYETIDDNTIKYENEIFKRIEDTEGYINKDGVLYRNDLKTMKQIKSDQFKINGQTYFIKTVLRRLFGMKTEKPSRDIIIQEKEDQIIKQGYYKNKPIIKDIPEDMKQIKEYNGRILKDCYYFSDNNFKLYHKIENTNQYFEIKNYRKIESCDKKYKIKTFDNKTINFHLFSKDAPISLKQSKSKTWIITSEMISNHIKQNKQNNEIKNKTKDNNIFNPDKQNKILKEGTYKNKPIIKDISDMKEYIKHRGTPLKEGYYISKVRFGLYKKIPNTDLYYELENRYPEYLEKYEYKRKYYTVKTTKNKILKITFDYDMIN